MKGYRLVYHSHENDSCLKRQNSTKPKYMDSNVVAHFKANMSVLLFFFATVRQDGGR